MGRSIAGRGVVVPTLLTLALLIIGTWDLTVTASSRGEVGGYLGGEEVYNSTRSLSGGLGVDDLDGDGVSEVVFCDFEGNVILLEPSDDGDFKAGKIWQEEGEPGTDRGLFDLVITDALSSSSGPEVLAAGYSGKLHALYRSDDGWRSKVLVASPFRIFEMELGDIDPAPGMEVLYGSMQNNQVDPDRFLRYIRRTSGDLYEQVEIPVPDAVKAIHVADADPDIEGEEIWITTSAWNDKGGTISTLVEVWNDGGTWRNKVLFTDPNNLLTNVKIGELWSGHEGNEMVITSLSGWCYLGYMEGGKLKVDPVFQARTQTGSSFGLEGLALGDINPRHPGDEALVTGYYNRVYQVVEVGGEVTADLAWEKESTDIKLELSGLEIADVTEDHPGNEGLVASLQGWIQMLHYEQDGLSVEVPGTRYDLIQGGEATVPVRIVPKGLLRGQLSIEVETDPSVDVMYPADLSIEDHDPLDLTMIIEAKGPQTQRDLDLEVTARVGQYTAMGTIRLALRGSSGGVTLYTLPTSGVVYTAQGSHLRVKVGLLGGEEYDSLDLEASEPEGLLTSVNTPIIPGEEEFMTILPAEGAAMGVRTVTLSAVYNGIVVSEAEFVVEVRRLADDLHATVTDLGNGLYRANLIYNGSVEVNHISVEFFLGSRTIGSFEDVNLVEGSNISAEVQLKKGETGILTIFVEDLGRGEIETLNKGLIGQPTEEDDGLDPFWMVVAILVVLIAVVIVVVVLMYIKGTSESDARIDRVGQFRYGRTPVRPPGRIVVGGRPSEPFREQQPQRRAPPMPFGPPGRGPGRR